jgi:hypothetical protein
MRINYTGCIKLILLVTEGKNEIFKHYLVPMSHCPSQTPYVLVCGKIPTNNCLRYGKNAKYSITTYICTSIVKLIKKCNSSQIREMKYVSRKEVNFTVEHVTKSQRRSKGIALLFL